jgi:release factor glutamine methyltransferase
MTTGAAAPISGGCRTVGSLIIDIRRQLMAAEVESAGQEAVWLIDHALGLSGVRQVVDRTRVLSEGEVGKVQALVARRAAREPLQYILGTQEFCGLEFEVNPSVLIPRPETELLVREAIRRLPQGKTPTLVDVGTGSGCLAVALARSIDEVRIAAVDLSSRALQTAKKNAQRHGVREAITWFEGDLLAPLAGRGFEGNVTVVVSNPPYIREADWPTLQPEVGLFEPRTALVSGPRGTELHERLLDEAVPFLIPGGLLVMELGRGKASHCAKR